MGLPRQIGVAGLLLFSVVATAQTAPPPATNVGGWRAPANNPGTGSGDIPASSLPPDRKDGMLNDAYGLDLSRRIAAAHKLVDEVNHGRSLTDGDTHGIRNLMREDFISWNKQFDLPAAAYRAERDRWLVEPRQLSPSAWAQQRLKWLEAQRAWILARTR